MSKISCLKANCTLCEKAVLVKANKFGERLYACPINLKPHKTISAYDCKDFRCDSYDENIGMCRTCSRGR